MFTVFDYLIIVEILIVLIASFTLTLFPMIILRTRAISGRFRFLLLLLWLSHFLLVLAHAISITMRFAHQDIPMCCLPWDEFQTFRLIHDVGFYLTTTAMFLLIVDRFLFTILYESFERREKYFQRVMVVTVPFGFFIASFWAYRADVADAVAEACLIAHSLDLISCVFCVITFFRIKRKYRESFTRVTLDTRYSIFESQELTFALLPVCVMAVILKNVSLTTIWIYAINDKFPHAFVMLGFYSDIIGCKLEDRSVPSEKEQYARYFEMMGKQWK